MNERRSKAFSAAAAQREYERQLREMNEALLVSSVREHELVEQAEQAEALVQCQNDALEMVVREAPLDDVLGFLVRAVEGQSHEGMAAIHLLNPAGTHFASAQAPSLPAAYLQATEGLAIDSRSGPCCDAVLSGESVIVTDVETDPRYPRFAKIALACGIRAGWSTPVFSAAGKVVGTFANYYREPREPSAHDKQLMDVVTRTVTLAIEHKLAEEAQARLAAIVASSEDAITSKDLGGIITSWNRGAQHLFGYAAEEIIGKPMMLLIPPDRADEEPEILARIRRGEPVEQYETVRRRKDGSLIDISLTISPLRDAAGRIVGASKIARDITARVRLARQTREQAAELADLHRRKDEFLAMLSHELRNPLAPIANAVQLLRLEKNPGAIQEQARTIIERQVGQLSRLIEDLMEVSRISTGRIHLQEERLNLRGIVERAAETVRPLIAQRRHALTVVLPAEPIWLNGDAGRLEQVIVNLLTNAAKYTDDAGQIWVGVEQAGDEATVRVRDTGVGIAPELLPRIFDLFTQGERSLDRAAGGLGVGLALVRQIVQLHRGRVEAHSVVGQGSEFVVRLPVVHSLAPATKLQARNTAPSNTRSCRILVVDDNVDTAHSLSMLLRQFGHDVHMAHTGPTAIREAIVFQPQVVLLDIGLPDLDGFEVAKQIREHPDLKKTVLVAMTGYGQERDRARSREAGFDQHLVKPVDFRQVQQILERV